MSIKNIGLAIECYQCNSTSTMECGDGLMNLDGGILKPTSCEHVFNSQYCIKLTGFFSAINMKWVFAFSRLLYSHCCCCLILANRLIINLLL